jgi:hypothetical protein
VRDNIPGKTGWRPRARLCQKIPPRRYRWEGQPQGSPLHQIL